ncbi:MAG: SDR family oxidoreductase [Chloroflexi bacterium]|nr:SDR family oxidoreductase [Chloroflexota bacterium]
MTIFKNKVVIITGASSGIGRQMALDLAEDGAWLVLAARSLDKLNSLEDECTQLGARAISVQTDVSDENQCKALIDATIAEFDRIDILINNAGITARNRFDEMQVLWPFEKVMQVNYLGSVYCSYYALPHLKKSKGQLVGVSSMTGKVGVPNRSAYSASKFAMVGFFDALRVELADSGVSVTVTYPDFVETGSRLESIGPDGNSVKEAFKRGGKVMGVEEASEIMLEAIAQRKRESILSTRGKFTPLLKILFPNLVDRLVQKAANK